MKTIPPPAKSGRLLLAAAAAALALAGAPALADDQKPAEDARSAETGAQHHRGPSPVWDPYDRRRDDWRDPYRDGRGWDDHRWDRRGWDDGPPRRHPARHGRWSGPEGVFLVYARACPDLREDRRDRRFDEGWRDRREDRRDRRVIVCPPRAWEYLPSAREARFGLYGNRLRPREAYYSRRYGGFVTDTVWGPAPVRVVWR